MILIVPENKIDQYLVMGHNFLIKRSSQI